MIEILKFETDVFDVLIYLCESPRASNVVKGRSPRLFAETVKLLKQGVCRSINEKEKVSLQFLRLQSID